LGLPDWEKIFDAYNIPVTKITNQSLDFDKISEILLSKGPHGFIVELDPEQLFFPKVTSRVLDSGAMKTNPIHLMSPELSEVNSKRYLKYVK